MASAHSGMTNALTRAESITVSRNKICRLGDSALLAKLTLTHKALEVAEEHGSVR